MPEDRYQKELLDDLRSLRRMEGEPDAARLVGRRRLIEQLGSGSIKAAYHRFIGLAEEAGSEVGSDIHAYFFTIGLGVGGYNLDDRLRRYSETYHVVEKTALRRSDRGVVALSHIIRDRSVVQRPEVMIWLTQDGPIGGFTANFWAIAGTSFREPTIYVNGKSQELPDLEWAEWGDGTNQLKARHRVLVDLREAPAHEDRLVNFHMWWHTDLLPNFELRTTIADSRLMPALRVSHSNRASAELYWQHEDDRCSIDELKESAYNFGD